MTTAPINCSHSAVWPLADFKPHPRNVNTHPEEQLRLLAKVIVGNGWRSPICVSKRSGLVIKGHGRLAAAQLAGLETAPVDLQDYADEAAEIADLIADNRLSALAEIDMTALKEVLGEMSEGGKDLETYGFTADAFALIVPCSTDAVAPQSSSKEIDVSLMTMECRCPKCGFEFDREKKA